jgi:adenosine deaminase
LHLYGCIRAPALLAHVLRNEAHIDFSHYERAFEAAYGCASPIRPLLSRCRAGDPEAHAAFATLFEFGDDDAGNFARFQAKFDLLIASSAISWPAHVEETLGRSRESMSFDEIEEFTAAICEEQACEGVEYAECRWFGSRSPQYDKWPDTLRAMHRGANRAGRRHAFRVAASLPRHDPWPQWEAVSALAQDPEFGSTLTAVDFCFVEEGHPPLDKREFFSAVRAHNERRPDAALAILYHVGESFTDKSLESAVRWVHQAAQLGAHRLGHAIALGIDPSAIGPHLRDESVRERRDQLAYDLEHAAELTKHGVLIDRAAAEGELLRLEGASPNAIVSHTYDSRRLDEVRARQDYAMACVRSTGAVIEVCPTSNRRIGGITDAAHHPVHRFLAAKLPVVVASDDPGIFGTSLREEIAWVARVAGLSQDERDALGDAAWDARSEVVSGRERALEEER